MRTRQATRNRGLHQPHQTDERMPPNAPPERGQSGDQDRPQREEDATRDRGIPDRDRRDQS